MSSQMRVGVVGVGYMGKLHAGYYANHSDVDLVGVVDVDQNRSETIASELGCSSFTNSEDLVGKVDAVSVAVPSSLHYPAAKPFIEAGVHILMEKPLASSVDDAEKIVDLANKHKVKLLVGHQERFNSAVMAAAERISMPKFINAQRLGQFAGRNDDVDVITDLMIHDIDLILVLTKSPVTEVLAMGATVITDHVDVVNARIQFESGAVANVTASRASSKRERTMEIYEGSQMLSLNLIDQTITSTSVVPSRSEDDANIVEKPVTFPKKQTLETEVNHFVETLTNGVEPLVTGEDGLLALKVARMVHAEVAQAV